MKLPCMLLMVIATMLVGCDGDSVSNSASSSGSRDSDSDKSSTKDDTKKPDEPGKDEKPPEPEKLPGLHGDELQIGKVYKNGEAVKMSMYGVSFKLPADCGVVMQKDATAMTLQSTTMQSLGFVFFKREVNESELETELRQPQEIDDGVTLSLQGDFERKSRYTLAKYADDTYVGYAAFHIGPEKNGILFFLGGYKADEAHFKEKVEALADSIGIGKPLESQSEQEWKAMLAGNMLTYLKSYSSTDGVGGGVYSSTNIEIRLYPDGTYRYHGSDSFSVGTGSGGSASGGKGGDETGTWKVEQIGTVTYLKCNSEGGSRQYKLEYADKKTYLNGTRYFRTPIE